MVADDSRVMRMLVGMWLARMGAKVIEASDGLDAISLLDGVDAVFLDINMPKASGLTVLDHIRRQNPELPVALMTTLGQKADVAKGIELGAKTYLTKPLEHSQLVLALAHLGF